MDDEIGDALAIALEAIEEHAGEARYSSPVLAAQIQSARAAMEELQLCLEENMPGTGAGPRLHVVRAHAEAPDDGTPLTPGRSDGPKSPAKSE